MSWWHYLLLVNLYLILFFGFYKAFLRKETFFQLNRIYLVSGSLLSFFIPLMQSDWIRQLFITQRVHQTIYATVNPQFIYTVKPVESTSVTLGQIIAYIYVAGAALLLARLIYQLFALRKLVNSENAPSAFSFFKKIKVDGYLPNQQTIIEHEQVHTRQWHSADVLLIETVMIINWFNPIVYFYRKAIKRVHEYIADRKAIETGTSKTEYALLLLSQTFGTVPQQLTNNFFNNSLLKQRILMLNQSESNRRALLKYGLSAPLFAAMLIFSSATVNNSRIIRIINKTTEQFSISSVNFTTDEKDLLSLVGTDAGAIPEQNRMAEDNSNTPQQTTTVTTTVTNVVLRKDSTSVPDNSTPIFNAVEIQPNFPGGEQAFGRFLSENIIYPDKAREVHTTGRVFIRFVVEKDGALSDLKCLRDPGNGLGQEAIRVLSISPRWRPGIQNGRTVRVQFTVPVNFVLNDAGTKTKPDTIRLTSAFKKPMTVFVYKHVIGPDSSGTMPMNVKRMVNYQVTTIKINGKTITKDEFYNVNPRDIESINVIKRDTSKFIGQDSKDLILIRTKTTKSPEKG